jgi:hypothetical protein
LAPEGVRSSSSSKLLTEKRREFSVAVKLTSSDTGADVDEMLGVGNTIGEDCRTPEDAVSSIRP